MKRILQLVLFLALIPHLAFAQETSGSEVILKLEQQWETALVRSDVGALDTLYDSNLVYTHSNGKVDNKATYLEAIRTGASQYQSMKRDEIKVSLYGKTALVTCHWEVHVLAGGNKIDLNARYLHVYVQQPDGWKLVAHQATRIAQ